MKKIKSLFELFFIMFKIGIFTFGGGYAMIGILEHEFVEKRKWVEKDEFIDLVAIAESTPGPISINCSTFIGYKTNKILGAIIATLAMCLPSFIIIYLISLFFNNFLEIEIIAKAFSGIRIAVIFLIFFAGFKFFKNIKINFLNVFILVTTGLVSVLLNLFAISFSSICYILISGVLGLICFAISNASNNKTKVEREDNK